MKLLILLVGSTLDRLLALGTVTLGAVSMGHDVAIYATQSASFAFLKDYADKVSDMAYDSSLRGFIGEVMRGYNEVIINGKFFRWYEMLRQAKEIGHSLRIRSC